MIRAAHGPLKHIGNAAQAVLLAALTFACSSTSTHVDNKKHGDAAANGNASTSTPTMNAGRRLISELCPKILTH